MMFIKKFCYELFDLRYLFLEGGYRFKKWGVDCKKKIKYKSQHIK